jgi:class 3 adenylate cyclase
LQRKEVVEINSGAHGSLRPSRRRLLRFMGPIGFVILVMAALISIAAYAHYSYRRDALALSNDLLAAIERRIAGEFEAYLLPVENVGRLAVEALKATSFDIADRAVLEAIGFRVIADLTQVSILHVSDPHGNFFMLKEMPDGSLHTKIIDNTHKPAKVTWIRRDIDGNVVDEEISEDDSYDPRNRPWYTGAATSGKLFWSQLYIFFTDQKPGITVTIPIIGRDDQLMGVLGLDIELTSISVFLETLKIGRHGRALIITGNGRVAAHPEYEKLAKKEGEVFNSIFAEELGDPVLTRAYNRFRINGHGHYELTVDDQKYLFAAFSLLETMKRDYSVFVIVPQDDFVGFVTRNNRNVLLMSISIVTLAAMMAVWLVVQGLRADRNARLVLERQSELEAQSRAFSELSSKAVLFDTEEAESFTRLTEIVTTAIGDRRTSVWHFADGGGQLRCTDCFDRESKGHTQGTTFFMADFPQLFELLRDSAYACVDDAGNDPRLAELTRVYLQPLGCGSLLSVPIRYHDQTVGALWFEYEHRSGDWTEEEISFAHAIANMLALRFAVDQKLAPVSSKPEKIPDTRGDIIVGEQDRVIDAGSDRPESPPAKPDFFQHRKTRAAAPGRDRLTSFSERLAAGGIDPARVGADIFDETTVLVLQFTDPVSLAERIADRESITAVDSLVGYVEDLAASRSVDYLKVQGDAIVCAAGIENSSRDHALVMADLALALQDRCTGLFAELNIPMEFRIGLDTGAVMGSAVGRGQKTYNIWGEAMRFASKMASSGLAGGIHVSETSYRRLRSDYLFHVRGKYFLPNIGETTTYLLTGRI